MMTHVLHCPWFRESKIYRLYGCEQLHGLRPSITPDESCPLAYGVDGLPVDQGNQSTPVRPRAIRKRAEAWSQHKDEIRRLYIDLGRPLKDVMTEMKKRGFEATDKQYKLQIKRWGLRKRLTPHEQSQILREARQNKTILPTKGKSITLNGVIISSRRASRLRQAVKIAELGTTGDNNQASTPLSARIPYSSQTHSSFSYTRSKLETPQSDVTPDFDYSSAPTSPSVCTDEMSCFSPLISAITETLESE